MVLVLRERVIESEVKKLVDKIRSLGLEAKIINGTKKRELDS